MLDAPKSRIAGLSKAIGDSLRAKVEGIAEERAMDPRESLESLSAAELRQRLQDIHAEKIELETQNAALLLELSDWERLPDEQAVRQLFHEYVEMYSLRDDRLTAQFSEEFSGFTGGGDFLVRDRERWIAITREDFAQVRDPLRIELKDLAVQILASTIAVATGFFHIHLPMKDEILSRLTARLVLIFRKEGAGWKISHSSISIPYHLVSAGEIYPLKELTERNESLERLVDERTKELASVNADLERANRELEKQVAEHRLVAEALRRSEGLYRSILQASPDNITITDNEGRIRLVSPVAVTMFRATVEEEFWGHPVLDFLVPEDRERALSQIRLKRQGAGCVWMGALSTSP
jgi:PAS domain-containing protein